MSGLPTISRRTFVSGAVAVSAGGLVLGATGAAATGTTTAWTLDPAWGYPRGQRGATSCRCGACHGHADNKLFGSAAAGMAAEHRAHPGCLCVPAPLELPTAVYDALFPAGSDVVDQRQPAVAAVLAAGGVALPVTTPEPAPAPAADPVPTPAPTSAPSPPPADPKGVPAPATTAPAATTAAPAAAPATAAPTHTLGSGSASTVAEAGARPDAVAARSAGSSDTAPRSAVAPRPVAPGDPARPTRPTRPTTRTVDVPRAAAAGAGAGSHSLLSAPLVLPAALAVGAASGLLWLRRRQLRVEAAEAAEQPTT